MPRDHKVILVTGASSGFGRALVEEILVRGDIAVATLRKPSVLDDLVAKYPQDKLLVLPLDVTKKDQIKSAFAKVKEVYGKLDVVISNAGVSLMGEVEATEEDVARNLFEINFWGLFNVTREAVAFFREVNKPQGGHIVAISSLTGLVGFAGYGVYSASKHAMEGLMESLSKEVDPAWNIKVSIIEPGTFKTSVVDNCPVSPMHPAYDNPSLPSTFMRTNVKSLFDTYGSDPVKGVRAILELVVDAEQPPLRLLVGDDANAAAAAKVEELKSEFAKYKDKCGDLK